MKTNFLFQIDGFPGLFHFRHKNHPKRVKYENLALTEKIYQYEDVLHFSFRFIL